MDDARILEQSDPAVIRVQQAMFAKNLSMLGAALLITQFGAGRISIDDLKKDHESAPREAYL